MAAFLKRADSSSRRARLPGSLLLRAVVAWFLVGNPHTLFTRTRYDQHNLLSSFEEIDPCSEPMRGRGVPTFKSRDELGNILEEEGKTIGVELGVQRGFLSKGFLTRWPSCKEYHMVDL